MVGGGVKATGGRDEFTGHLHAHEHFAPGLVVVAGGSEDIFDLAGSGTIVQEVENGLPVQGTDGAVAEALKGGRVLFSEPVDGENAGFGDEEFVGKEAGWAAEWMPSSEEEVATFA